MLSLLRPANLPLFLTLDLPTLPLLPLLSISQNLKLIVYIKNQNVIILIDSGNTHNFIHHRISQETHFYIHEVNNIDIMIANGDSMKCVVCSENVCLQIWQYNLKYHMFSIDMDGCDIVLSAEWLHTLGPILLYFKELNMQFQHDAQQYKLQRITSGSPKIISSHRMENLLKKGHSKIISQVHSIQAIETTSMHPDLQCIISKHQVIFSTP
jgi:hypothetical protein